MRPFLLILTIFFLVTLFFDATCQASYKYKGRSNMNGITMFTLSDGYDSVSFTDGIKGTGRVRQVITMKGSFTFRYNNATGLDDIFNQDGTKVATARGFYDVTFLNGKFFDHKSVSNGWKYVCNGKVVIQGNYNKKEDGKYIEINMMESFPEEQQLLWAMSQIYGVDLIKKIARRPIRITLAVITIGILIANPITIHAN